MDMMAVGLISALCLLQVAMVVSMLSLYKKCAANEALIITGSVPSGIRVVRGGGMVVWPFINQSHSLSMETISIEVGSQQVMISRNGAALQISALAHVKVGDDSESIIKAAERFLTKPKAEICRLASEILDGHLRACVATMTIDEITQGLEALALRVQEASVTDMTKMGQVVEFFTIKEVRKAVAQIDAGKNSIDDAKLV